MIKTLAGQIKEYKKVSILTPLFTALEVITVSYTHLDVYKRQHLWRMKCFRSFLGTRAFPQ